MFKTINPFRRFFMSCIRSLAYGLAIILNLALAGQAAESGQGLPSSSNIQVDDAYARGSADGTEWTIGTKAVQLVFQAKNGQFRLISFENRTRPTPVQYLTPRTAVAPFVLDQLKLPIDGQLSQWTLGSATCMQVNTGGRPAVQLVMILTRESLRVKFHIMAFPRTGILRQWLDLENIGTAPLKIPLVTGLILRLKDQAWSYTTVTGAANSGNSGTLKTALVKPGFRDSQSGGDGNVDFIPFIILKRAGPSNDGWFAELDHEGNAKILTATMDLEGSINVEASSLANTQLAPKQILRTPVVTWGVFKNDLDDMAQRLYAWQYEFLWDYTDHDWFGRMLWAPAWTEPRPILQENWSNRLNMDLDFPDLMRTTGMTLVWDDAGWSNNGGSYHPGTDYDGPDFANTLRYTEKMGMKWLLWISNPPTPGVMNGKVGAWGDFQWRTDFHNWSSRARRDQIRKFREDHPASSFHSCNCGSQYAHTFDMQRLTDINMLADPGWGAHQNYYLSYFEVPDKWMDIMPPYYTKGKYLPVTARTALAMVPCWDQYVTAPDLEQIRKLCEIYRFLTCEGVAGRWSLMFHPEVKGDAESWYLQRTSFDRKKVCVILKHQAPGAVTIFPRGLLAEYDYTVGFDSKAGTTTRSGADLMTKGITIEKQEPGELIYLGLPNRPGSGSDSTPPKAPSRVISRVENNIGHSGVGVYWSPGSDDRWISYYEVQRGTTILGKASVGTYYFDHSDGWSTSAAYAIRTVDGDGNVSDWTPAQRLSGEPETYSALGGLFSTAGRDGWSARTSSNGETFEPMTWTEVRMPTGNGGVIPKYGWWTGAKTAQVGRGWQRTSKDAQCIRTWTAPKSGTVRIMGRVMKDFFNQKGDTLRVKIQHGVKPIWPSDGWAEVKESEQSDVYHDVTLKVEKNDVLNFVLDKGQDPTKEVISWSPRIVFLDEKSQVQDSVASTVRLRCGANEPYIDSTGNVWSEDQYFVGGSAVQSKEPVLLVEPNPTDQALYQAGRAGKDFTYSIPVKPGIYSVRLKLAETQYQWSFQRPMHLMINGLTVLSNFDICQAARGPNKAYEKVFRHLVPNAEGKLVLRFLGGWEPTQATDQALVQAIEVVPETKPVIRIACGREMDYIDSNGMPWSKDQSLGGGKALKLDQPKKVARATPNMFDQDLYRTASSSNALTYRFALPSGHYTVHLKFAELWQKQPGKRPMNIDINGRRVWENWDPATAAEKIDTAFDLRVENITPDKSGKITIHVAATGASDAILQAIEIE